MAKMSERLESITARFKVRFTKQRTATNLKPYETQTAGKKGEAASKDVCRIVGTEKEADNSEAITNIKQAPDMEGKESNVKKLRKWARKNYNKYFKIRRIEKVENPKYSSSEKEGTAEESSESVRHDSFSSNSKAFKKSDLDGVVGEKNQETSEESTEESSGSFHHDSPSRNRKEYKELDPDVVTDEKNQETNNTDFKYFGGHSEEVVVDLKNMEACSKEAETAQLQDIELILKALDKDSYDDYKNKNTDRSHFDDTFVTTYDNKLDLLIPCQYTDIKRQNLNFKSMDHPSEALDTHSLEQVNISNIVKIYDNAKHARTLEASVSQTEIDKKEYDLYAPSQSTFLAEQSSFFGINDDYLDMQNEKISKENTNFNSSVSDPKQTCETDFLDINELILKDLDKENSYDDNQEENVDISRYGDIENYSLCEWPKKVSQSSSFPEPIDNIFFSYEHNI